MVWPAVTVTVAGTVRLALLLESDTWSPPPGAAALNVTVQVVLAGVAMADPRHPTVLNEEVCETDTTIPADPPLAGTESAANDAATTLVRLIGIVPAAPGESWKVAVATKPSLMVFVFNP